MEMFHSGRSAASWRRPKLLAGLVAGVLVAGGAAIAWGLTGGLKSQPQPAAIGGPFTLIAGDGQKLSDRDFQGKWLLTYFGYTNCPDICPTTLADISETLKLLGPLASSVQPLFITIDPERDTPDAVATFVHAFDDRIVGLTGTPAQIAAVAKEYRVYYAKNPPNPAEGTSYAMDHTAFVYVMGPDGKYLTLFSPLQGQMPEDMAAKLRDLIGRTQSG
jgi:cytochrome oxidase Cu insertion factor (SCO1/SenC/PrrC family)